MSRKRTVFILVLLLFGQLSYAEWTSFFAYNKVNCIAASKQEVYAISNGSLFSVNKITEKITKYDNQSGLHATGISQIFYDNTNQQLLIFYKVGKIDVLNAHGVEYIDGLYKKDFTYDKLVNNITEKDGIAYLSTSFGIVTMNLERREIIDTYFIGSTGGAINVLDVVFEGDSIYAFTDNYVLSACTKDNIVDFHVWKQYTSSYVKRDLNKGVRVTDQNGDIWLTSQNQGLIRQLKTGEQMTYKPKGPAQNTPYSLQYEGGRLYMLPGGRWATQNSNPGVVMIFDGNKWTNITPEQIKSVTGNPALDFMNVAVDPKDNKHFFVTSYGTGLYEFQDDKIQRQFLPGPDNLMANAVNTDKRFYTRCDGALYDKKGNLLFLQATSAGKKLVAISPEGKWSGIIYYDQGEPITVSTPSNLVIDNRNQNIKVFAYCRENPGLLVSDDGGTLTDESDDVSLFRTQWIDQSGREIKPEKIYMVYQTSKGDFWLGTEMGPIQIASNTNMFASNACYRLRIEEGDAFIMDNEDIRAIAEDNMGQLWFATNTLGVYVLSPDAQQIVAHYTSDNSAMPSNSVLSLAWDRDHQVMYIGTTEGLAATGDIHALGGIRNDSTNIEAENYEGTMLQWRLHPSYATMQQVVATPSRIYGLANGALFSVDQSSDEIEYYNKMDGLHGNNITHIAYNQATDQLLVVYSNGMMDLIGKNDIFCMLELYQKAANMSMTVQDVFMKNEMAYLAMPFGIIKLNLRKREVAETYYIGQEGSDVDVKKIVCTSDSIFASSTHNLYHASLQENLLDYSVWTSSPIDSVSRLLVWNDQLYAQMDSALMAWTNQTWTAFKTDIPIAWSKVMDNKLLIYSNPIGYQRIMEDGSTRSISSIPSTDVDYDAANACYWGAVPKRGLVRFSDGQSFAPNGPISNFAYKLKFIGDRLFVCPGGRWAIEYQRSAHLSFYQNGLWSGWDEEYIKEKAGLPYWTDVVSVAAPASNPSSYFVGSYGMSLLQFVNDQPHIFYHEGNSTLRSAVDPGFNIRVDGMMCDEYDNLWVINTNRRPNTINVRTPNGQWYAYNIYVGGNRVQINTPGETIIDKRDSRYKWLYDQRGDAGIFFLYDNGTPTIGTDDRAMKRNVFFDQKNAQVTLNNIYTVTQDRKNDVWIGTDEGIVIIPAEVDFFTQNTCYRVLIPRNDGTNLADYLLGTERINSIAVDGGNRKWIGTEGSGVYLVSDDGQETIYHFTEENSPLPSNSVLSIAIDPHSGEVFFGTANGIASFRSDASEPAENYDAVYAYPNPVHENYTGVITIQGLMDNSFVTIIDGGGNVVCKTRSQGGIAVWDGKLPNGKRAATGVYTVLCNAAGSKAHTVTKIMFVR